MEEELTKTTLELLRVLAATAKCATTEEISKITGIPEEAIEKHLEVLRQQGLILDNKEGKHCSLEDARMLKEKLCACERCFGHTSTG